MSKPLVYLAGPIAALDYAKATDWRDRAAHFLAERGIGALDPMRAKQQLAGGKIGPHFKDYAKHGPFFTSGGIMLRDFTDVKRCDALLVNLLGCEKITAGTAIELGWAYAMQKPVVVLIEAEGNPHDAHPMLIEAIGALRFDNLLDAVDAVAILLGVE